MPKFTAVFTPQAWVNGWPIEVDPEGPTEWDVTAAIAGPKFNGVVPRADDYPSDDLRFEANAPQWVKDWSGPFYIEVRIDPASL